MEESVFLSDFFGCVGFLPLTTQSHIRETMVEMMTAPAPLQQPAIAGIWDEETRFSEIERRANCRKASDVNQLPMNPQSCTFWCAIALGAVAKGNPVESVEKYSQLAQEALPKSVSGPADAEVAKAWAMLAYLCGFMGDLARYQEYLAVSESFFRSSVEHGSTGTLPLGFAEVVKFTEVSDSCCGQRQINWSSGEEQAMPQLNEAATEGEIYRYVAQSLKAFEQGTHAIANEQRVKAGETPCEDERDGRSNGARPSRRALLPTEISNAMSTLMGSGGCTEFGPLQGVMDGNLVFEKAATLDLDATLERVGRCIEVFERYPGLCRGTMGYHKAHMVLVWLAAIDDSRARAMYNRLRGSYNPFRRAGSRPVPLLEEWHGVATFCDDVYCRAIENIITSEPFTALAAPSIDGIDVCDGAKGTDNCKGEAALVGSWQAQGEKLSACNIPPTITDTASDRPTESGAECGSGLSVVSKSPIATPVSSQNACTQSNAGLISNGVENGTTIVAVAPESFPRFSQVWEGGDLTNDTEGDGAAAEDWLDVTYAMLRAL
ncbi:hypothetical protein Esi_0093_0019 [Ectocarpus siliculosus]|uniref:Uncharacterized protein n=1 Tax=Ectocarpus siliculosus TaxID=2880 RepID=D8LU10_ECTSI|nr:hypothetical protein Esi_0093_0019 [Ectocarpus siliculosus]|eukprot:CBN75400.1 hypothetical protein Esi_0093_0019 [Ectocarpus siliculosus]